MAEDNIKKLRQLSTHLVDPEIAVLIFESLPDALFMVDNDGAIMLVNRQAELLFGYHRSELFDQSIEMLVPDELRKESITHRSSYVLQPKARATGCNFELKGLCKNGLEFPIQINLSPIITPQGIFTLAMVRNK